MLSKFYAFEQLQHFWELCAILWFVRNSLFYRNLKSPILYKGFNHRSILFDASPFPRKHCIEHVEYVSFQTSDSTVHFENRLVRMSTNWYNKKCYNLLLQCCLHSPLLIISMEVDIHSFSFFLDLLQLGGGAAGRRCYPRQGGSRYWNPFIWSRKIHSGCFLLPSPFWVPKGKTTTCMISYIDEEFHGSVALDSCIFPFSFEKKMLKNHPL